MQNSVDVVAEEIAVNEGKVAQSLNCGSTGYITHECDTSHNNVGGGGGRGGGRGLFFNCGSSGHVIRNHPLKITKLIHVLSINFMEHSKLRFLKIEGVLKLNNEQRSIDGLIYQCNGKLKSRPCNAWDQKR